MVLETLGNGSGELNDNPSRFWLSCFRYQQLTRNHIKSVLDLELLKGWMW